MATTFPKLTRLHKAPAADAFGIANSPLGYFLCAWEGPLLVRLHLLPAHAEKKPDVFFKDWGMTTPKKRDDARAATLVNTVLFSKNRWTGAFSNTAQLGFYGTDFQWNTMQKMNRIAPGKTVSYGQLAASPGAARAAGSVCANNPLPFLVPCHRVLATNGGLGGYGYGTALKRQLLDWEA